MSRIIVLLLIAASTAGCISRRSGGTIAGGRKWTTGYTTRRDVVEAWGNPDSIKGNIWTWREVRQLGGRLKASYYGVGLTVSSLNAATCEHRLEFDGEGRLVARETVHSIPESASWSIIPW